MKTILVAIIAAVLTACGGGQIDNAPSSSAAVPCSQSAECLARVASKDVIKTCSESFMGTPAVMMSTWDNGKSWLRGNCDQTAS